MRRCAVSTPSMPTTSGIDGRLDGWRRSISPSNRCFLLCWKRQWPERDAMRIALVSTLATTVRPGGAGSVEGLVWLLSRELTRLGHNVTVFGAAGSETHGAFVATLPGPYATAGSPDDWQLCEWINLCR